MIYIYESCYIVAGAVSGICFFNEMANFSIWHYVIYALSMVQIILGIHVISQREVNDDDNTKVALLDDEESDPSTQTAKLISQDNSGYHCIPNYSL